MTNATSSSHSIEKRGSIALVQLDRAPVNALPRHGWRQLTESIHALSTDTAIRAVVLHGGHDRFCAGADINELLQPDPGADRAAMLTVVEEAADAIGSCRVPVIAAIDGPAHGGGLELAISCDLRVASPNATFAAAGVNMGLIASVASLVEVAGDTVARRMLLSGERIDAPTAHRWGLVTDLDDSPLDAAIALAESIARKPPLAIEATKAALNSSAARDSITDTFRRLAATDDHREALVAFQEKRPGNFRRT